MIEAHWVPEPIVVANQYKKTRMRWSARLEPMHESLDVVINDVEQQFAEEGPGWAPWAESYTDHGPSILTKTGELRSGATSPGSYEVNKDEIRWTGEEAPAYWQFHPMGTVKMPARNWIGLTPTGEEEVVQVFARWMDTL